MVSGLSTNVPPLTTALPHVVQTSEMLSKPLSKRVFWAIEYVGAPLAAVVKDPATDVVNSAVAGLVKTGAACTEPIKPTPKPKNRPVQPRDPDIKADLKADKSGKIII
jgi:hypothetical protein